MALGFEDDEFVLPVKARKRDRDAQLKGHVEARGLPNPAQIVDRDATRPNEMKDPDQSSSPFFRQFKDAMRHSAQRNQGTDEGNEQSLV